MRAGTEASAAFAKGLPTGPTAYPGYPAASRGGAVNRPRDGPEFPPNAFKKPSHEALARQETETNRAKRCALNIAQDSTDQCLCFRSLFGSNGEHRAPLDRQP